MLYRRVPFGEPWIKIEAGRPRPTSLAFQNSREEGQLLPEMSICLQDRLIELGRDPDTILEAGQGGIAQFKAGDVRALEEAILGVVRSATPTEPAHGDVTGWLDGKPVRRALARLAVWYRLPASTATRT